MEFTIVQEFVRHTAQAWQELTVFLAIGIAFTYLVMDTLYAYCTLAIARLQPSTATTTGTIIHFLLALGVLSYVHNYLYIIPIALGSRVGTYLVIKRNQRLHQQ